MITVSELAKEIGVTPQAIYKKINKPQFKPFIKKDKRRRTVITTDGVTLIKQSFNDLNESVEKVEMVENISLNKTNESVENEMIQHFKRTVESVENQLKIKDEQIKELLEQNKQLIKQNENSQSIIYSMQKQHQALLEQKDKKRKLLDFFKKPVDDERG